MHIVTIDHIPGFDITNLVADEVTGYGSSPKYGEAREQARKDLEAQAEILGADAVVGVRYSHNTERVELGGVNQVYAVGTPVFIRSVLTVSEETG